MIESYLKFAAEYCADLSADSTAPPFKAEKRLLILPGFNPYFSNNYLWVSELLFYRNNANSGELKAKLNLTQATPWVNCINIIIRPERAV